LHVRLIVLHLINNPGHRQAKYVHDRGTFAPHTHGSYSIPQQTRQQRCVSFCRISLYLCAEGGGVTPPGRGGGWRHPPSSSSSSSSSSTSQNILHPAFSVSSLLPPPLLNSPQEKPGVKERERNGKRTSWSRGHVVYIYDKIEKAFIRLYPDGIQVCSRALSPLQFFPGKAWGQRERGHMMCCCHREWDLWDTHKHTTHAYTSYRSYDVLLPSRMTSVGWVSTVKMRG